MWLGGIEIRSKKKLEGRKGRQSGGFFLLLSYSEATTGRDQN